jgi:glycosyltransferase involved in cell wall biosynthesis
MVTQPTDGGVFQHVAQLCEGLACRGYEPVVAGPFRERPVGLAAEVVRLDLLRAVAPSADTRAVVAAARLVRRLRPALVHAHSSKAGAVARLARVAFPRTPLVYTPHGYAFAGYFESESERTRYRVVERALAPLASIVLCVCEAERRLAASVGPERRTRFVHNGIGLPPPGVPHPTLTRLSERGPVIGVVTLLRPGKGIETLVDALPEVLAAHPEASVAIAGRGPDREQLAARARERGVADALHLIGETAGPMPLLAGADLFVSASWAESFPYSVLEAMAVGLPVVATDVGGTAEAVVHGETGLMVPPRNPQALAGAIRALLDDPCRRRALGKAGRRRVEERFTVERMLEGTIGVYRGLRALPLGAVRACDLEPGVQ